MTAYEHGRRAWVLAAALLAVEFVAGMQRYLSQTVMPLVGADFAAQERYAVINVAAQASLFLTLPLGGWLISRFRVGPLMMWFTALAVAGSLLCALAPGVWTFVAGTAVRGAAGGALATIAMGAVSMGLPTRLRQLVLGGMAGTWVVSSLAGPVYAAWVSEVLGWRWAMVLYLPVLVAARAVIATHLPPRAPTRSETAPLAWSLVLATGAVLLATPLQRWVIPTLAVGIALCVAAAVRLLPRGTATARRGRPAAFAALFLLPGCYFATTLVMSVVGYDALGLRIGEVAFVIGASGLAWGVLGLWTGARPAGSPATFRRRARSAAGLLMVAVAGVTGATWFLPGSDVLVPALVLAMMVAGSAMGLVYADLLGLCLTPAVDGISEEAAAAGTVIAETIGMVVTSTLAFSWLSTAWGLHGLDVLDRARALHPAVLLLTVPLPFLLHRAVTPRSAPANRAVTATHPERGCAHDGGALPGGGRRPVLLHEREHGPDQEQPRRQQ